MNFPNYKKKITQTMFSRFGLTLDDLSIEDEDLQLSYENNEKVGELASWYEEKFDLERL